MMSLKEIRAVLFKVDTHFHIIAYGFIFLAGFARIPLVAHFFSPKELGSYAIYNSILSYIDIVFFFLVAKYGLEIRL